MNTGRLMVFYNLLALALNIPETFWPQEKRGEPGGLLGFKRTESGDFTVNQKSNP